MNKFFLLIITIVVLSICSQIVNYFIFSWSSQGISTSNVFLFLTTVLRILPFLIGSFIFQFSTRDKKEKRKIWCLGAITGFIYVIFHVGISFLCVNFYNFSKYKEIRWIGNIYLPVSTFFFYILLGVLSGFLWGLIIKRRRFFFFSVIGLCFIIWLEIFSGYNRIQVYDVINNSRINDFGVFTSFGKIKVILPRLIKEKIPLFEIGIILSAGIWEFAEKFIKKIKNRIESKSK